MISSSCDENCNLKIENLKMKKIIIAVFLVFFTVFPALAALRLNDSVPVFSLPDSTGNVFYLSDVVGPRRKKNGQNGHGVILSFFASWCVPCRNELPLINSFVDELKNTGITVVLVDVKEDIKTINAVLAELKVDKPVVVSDRDGRTTEQFGVRFFPTTFFINADGKVKDVVYGGINGERELRRSVQKLLKR
jgi:thiol-disulfide isomerase/thioredoxin